MKITGDSENYLESNYAKKIKPYSTKISNESLLKISQKALFQNNKLKFKTKTQD